MCVEHEVFFSFIHYATIVVILMIAIVHKAGCYPDVHSYSNCMHCVGCSYTKEIFRIDIA